MELFPRIKSEERLSSPEPLESKATILQRPPKRGIESSDDGSPDRKKRLFLREPFIYSALRPLNEEIRLLTLEPSIDRTANIRCEIMHAAMKNAVAVSYDALSYTWGASDDKAERPISVQGCDMIVSTNLDLALRALRHPAESRTLWIDAICINQQSNRERSRQVSLMRKIYSLAQKTIIWLGEETRESTRAIEWISRMTADDVVTGIVPWEAVILLCRHSWFTRVWVVQEFVVGKNIEYLVGTKSFQAEKLELAIQYLVDEGYIGFMSEGNFGIEETKRISKMFQLKERQTPPVISQLLADFRNWGASVPHDKIYALLGLFEDLTLDPHLPSPDYDKPFRDVCIEWATYSLLNEKSLGILFSCERPRSTPDWPSWVPDWSITRTSVASLREVYPGWSATRGTKPEVSISQGRLTVSGVFITFLKGVHFDRNTVNTRRGLDDFPIMLEHEINFRHRCEFVAFSYSKRL
jgi:hypothetical protein